MTTEKETKLVTTKHSTNDKSPTKKVEDNSLPSIKNLFQESLTLFQKTILLYGKLMGTTAIVFVVLVFATILFSIPLVRILIDSHGTVFQNPTVYEILSVIFFAILTLIPLVLLIACSVILPITYLLILQSSQPESIRSLLGQSKPFIKSYFLTSLLSLFFILGGYFFLVIPGILISLFFLFVDYEIVFEKQNGIAALQRSYVLVSTSRDG